MIISTFSVRFHEPFLVRSGIAQDGLDAVARVDSVLPASSLKGAMRAASAHVLGVPDLLIGEIFGQPGSTGGARGQGAWAWTNAGPASAFTAGARVRNRVDHATGVVRPEALTFTQEWWQGEAARVTFAVEQIAPLESTRQERHLVVLQVAARAVTALGSWRNRGMGTVTIRPLNPLHGLAERWAQVVS
jgi:hypothetical protein